MKKSSLNKAQEWAGNRSKAIWANLLTNHLWQRILKNTLATTITIILALIPAVVRIYGTAVYLAPITTVFGHPGRRFGMMAEALVLAVSGSLVGAGWSTLGIYLSSLIVDSNLPAAYTIKGVFLAIALLFHGFLRSHSPRLFIFVLLLVIVSVVSLTGRATSVSSKLVTVLLYPILTAAGVLLLVNVLVFPEFSSDFLGRTTIETLGATISALRDAGRYFVTIAEEPLNEMDHPAPGQKIEKRLTSQTAAENPVDKNKTVDPPSFIKTIRGLFQSEKKAGDKGKQSGLQEPVKLKNLTDEKAKLRAKLASCKAAQQECNFEFAWAVLPPRDLKVISDVSMKKLVANTISLIGACESKYALIGDVNEKTEENLKGERVPMMTSEVETMHNGEKPTDPGAAGESGPGTSIDGSHDSGDAERHHRLRYRRQKEKTEHRSKSRSRSKSRLEQEKHDIELVKPKREIEYGDTELLKFLVSSISKPIRDLQEKIDRSVDVVTSCLAYCYDVKRLPSGALAPRGIRLEEIDIRVDILVDALADFDNATTMALEGAAAFHDLNEPQIDVMPRMETFLISSFLLNLRQAGSHTLDMLKHSRVIVEKRQARHSRRRLYAPRINWKKWLASGGEEDMLALPEGGRKDARTGVERSDSKEDESSSSRDSMLDGQEDDSDNKKKPSKNPSAPDLTSITAADRHKSKQRGSLAHRLRNRAADTIEYLAGSEDVLYAIKLTVAMFLVTFPAFVSKWNNWYYLNRGLWAALQLVLVTEVAIGTSVWTFLLRAVGTTFGCLWGYAAYQADHGNRVVCVVILVIGIIPSAYMQLGTKYIKAGMVSIISMSIVALAIIDASVPGTPTETFLRRFVAFLIGGVIALIVEVALFPVRARDRLVESLAASIRQITEMEACLAYGVESGMNVNDVHSKAVSERFANAKGKAQAALTAAETFLPFCDQEPRLKGSFKALALIYTEILYVLHAMVDKMDNMLQLRYVYGSGVLEELNSQVYAYRRNVAGSITLNLFAVHEALTTKLPLPQFLPASRLAHLRMVNRVREVVLESGPADMDHLEEGKSPMRSQIEMTMVKRILRKKFLAWNAASAGQVEVIEYLEELIDLVKLLVGANEFRSGILTRSTYREYVDRIDREVKELEIERRKGGKEAAKGEEKGDADEARDTMPEPETARAGLSRRRTTFSRSQDARSSTKESTVEKGELERQRSPPQEELPFSLQRVRSRRLEEIKLQKSRSIGEEQKRRDGKRTDVAK